MQKIAAPILCLWLSSGVLLVGATTGCVAPHPPYEEYSIARAAVRAAQDVDSARFSSGFWVKAEDSFRNGQKAYRESEFAVAKTFFEQATQFAEKAENATRLKKFQSGDNFP